MLYENIKCRISEHLNSVIYSFLIGGSMEVTRGAMLPVGDGKFEYTCISLI